MEKAYLVTQNTLINDNLIKYDRLYIGDQYCEHNMFYFFDDENFLENILKLNKNITITTPIISEKGLVKFKDFLIKNKDKFNNLEIVVNEYGILNLIKNEFPEIKIIWGNFLSGQNKDPYLKVFKDKNEHKNLSIDSCYYKNNFSKYNIERIELYNTFQGINLTQDFGVNMYFPFVVYSINRYCANALIHQNKQSVEIIENCNGCKGIEKEDFEMTLKIGEENEKQYYRGNKQFYENKKEINLKNVKRIIYNYDLI